MSAPSIHPTHIPANEAEPSGSRILRGLSSVSIPSHPPISLIRLEIYLSPSLPIIFANSLSLIQGQKSSCKRGRRRPAALAFPLVIGC